MRSIADIHDRIAKAFAFSVARGGDKPSAQERLPTNPSPDGRVDTGGGLENLLSRVRGWWSSDGLQEARAQSAAKSRQIATVVHEIRTPLNGILGMAHLLGQTKLTAEQQNYLSGIRQSGYALAQLVEDLLDQATMEAGRFRLNNRAENLRQLIESVVEMLAHRAHEKRIEVAATFAADLPELLDFDPARIRQVLFNVIGNAVKFTSEGGVLVQVRTEEGNVVIAVVDTGPGMTTEEQGRIFREFEQTGAAEARSGGTGLGLAISARILAEFGGSLSVSSVKGRGSTFTIRFPMRLAEDAPAGNGVRALLLSRSRVLLLAPDGPAARATVSTIETLGGGCRHVTEAGEVQLLIDRSAAEGKPFTDLIVDHRLASSFGAELTPSSPHRILLVNPEERASQPQDLYDAWLVRPLREKSLIDVLSGRLRGFGTRDTHVDGQPKGLATSESPDSGGLDVLLGEDDPVNALLVRAVLMKAGHRVRLVEDFESLLSEALSSEARPDLLLTDMHMPGGSMLEALSALREGERSLGVSPVPVLVLTGEGSDAARRKLLANGVSRVLEKPVEPRRLLEEVRRLGALAATRR